MFSSTGEFHVKVVPTATKFLSFGITKNNVGTNLAVTGRCNFTDDTHSTTEQTLVALLVKTLLFLNFSDASML